MKGARVVSAETVRAWFEQHPDARCALCETEKATTFHELWLDRVVSPNLDEWTCCASSVYLPC
jgi:hypothetical protein